MLVTSHVDHSLTLVIVTTATRLRLWLLCNHSHSLTLMTVAYADRSLRSRSAGTASYRHRPTFARPCFDNCTLHLVRVGRAEQGTVITCPPFFFRVATRRSLLLFGQAKTVFCARRVLVTKVTTRPPCTTPSCSPDLASTNPPVNLLQNTSTCDGGPQLVRRDIQFAPNQPLPIDQFEAFVRAPRVPDPAPASPTTAVPAELT